MKVAAIVPAYNEAKRLGLVLEAIRQASLVDETIIVNDGSTDNTSEVAAGCAWARVLDLPRNVGKGGAMYAGASSTDADIIIFLDADLIGLKGEHVDSIIQPVAEGRMDMCIGVFRGGRRITDIAQVIAPYISGQRALYRSDLLAIPSIKAVRSGVEVAMTGFFRANGLTLGTVTLSGCTHLMKEEKMGCIRGFAARLRMYYDIGKIVFDVRRRSAKRTSPADLRKSRNVPDNDPQQG